MTPQHVTTVSVPIVSTKPGDVLLFQAFYDIFVSFYYYDGQLQLGLHQKSFVIIYKY